ncbi:MAG: hypothetical protein FJ138_17370, partial [Deltaproteobacteria bacterium]|nr:hypothetical protein [Deltaproteobacteria bacterium]
MHHIAHTFFWAAARAMSHDLKVLVASSDAAQLAALAASAKEVVAIADAAPEGVKARADYKERASSKDLLVDPEGVIPAEDVARLLKKKGAYLCGVDRALGEGFAARVAVRPRVRLTAKALLSIGEGEGAGEALGDLSSGAAGAAGAAGVEGEPLFYLTAVSDLPALPALTATTDADAPAPGEDPAALQEALERLRAELDKAERAKKIAQRAKAEAAEALKAAEGARDEARAALEAAAAEGVSLKRQMKAAETRSAVAAERAMELGAAREALATSLAAEQARAAALADAGAAAARDLGAARAERDEAQGAIAALRAEANALQDDLKASRRDAKLNAERRERAEQAEAALKDAQGAFERVTSAWAGWLARGLDGALPPAPPARATLAAAWAEQLLARQPLVSATREEHQELLTLRVSLRESEARERQVTEERDEARLALAAERRRGGVTDATLLATLEAERALRAAAERRLEEQAGQFERYEAELARLQGALDAARRAGGAAPSAAGAAGDRERQLRAELKAHEQQRGALEQILLAQQALQAQLTQALSAEIAARSQAELARQGLEASARALEVQLDPELRLPRPAPTREPAPEPPRRPEPAR